MKFSPSQNAIDTLWKYTTAQQRTKDRKTYAGICTWQILQKWKRKRHAGTCYEPSEVISERKKQSFTAFIHRFSYICGDTNFARIYAHHTIPTPPPPFHDPTFYFLSFPLSSLPLHFISKTFQIPKKSPEESHCKEVSCLYSPLSSILRRYMMIKPYIYLLSGYVPTAPTYSSRSHGVTQKRSPYAWDSVHSQCISRILAACFFLARIQNNSVG